LRRPPRNEPPTTRAAHGGSRARSLPAVRRAESGAPPEARCGATGDANGQHAPRPTSAEERPGAGRLTEGERAFLALLALQRAGPGGDDGTGLGIDDSGAALRVARDDARCLLVVDGGGWRPAAHTSAESRAVLDLYLPLCSHAGRLAVAHLGQSLDGQIATAAGDSFYVTGSANLLHLQRMRALCDAVLVGAGTVAADDPRLTVRVGSGAQPVRVVLDPRRRLGADRRVFSDGAAPPLLVVDAALAGRDERHGHAEIVGIPARDGRLALDVLLDALRARGLGSIFVEGGGTTVSRFLEAKLLDRLQVAIAPLVIGGGRPGLDVPGCDRMGDCLRCAHRIFRMGDDVLIDCDLRSPPKDRADAAELVRVL